MGTRCQIQIEGNKALLYIHSDGYPDGILPTLLPFVEKFVKGRGDDPEYMLARMTQEFTNDSDQCAEEFRKKMAEKPGLLSNMPKERSLIGFGIDCDIHGDIEYLYLVKKGGTVEVQKVRGTRGMGTLGFFPVGTPVSDALGVCKRNDE